MASSTRPRHGSGIWGLVGIVGTIIGICLLVWACMRGPLRGPYHHLMSGAAHMVISHGTPHKAPPVKPRHP